MPEASNVTGFFRRTLRRLFERQEDAHLRETVTLLRHVPLFAGLSRATLLDVAAAVHPRTYQPGEYLYYERDPGLGLYIVRKGRLRLLAEDDDGAMHELAHLGAHEIAGSLSLLGDFPRTETAQAIGEVHVLGLFRPDLSTLTKRNPRAGAKVLQAVACHAATRQMELFERLAARFGTLEAARLLHDALPAPPVA